jgi:steroid delta-isomerase-like uncharacterized protein
MTTSRDEGETVVRRYIGAINAADVTALDALWARDLVWHGGRFGDVHGLAAFKQAIAGFLTAFPDLRIEIEDIVADHERVALRLRATAIHGGEFMGLEATGRRATWTAHPVYRVASGRIAEGWFCEDLLGLLQQLGGLPAVQASGRGR